VGSSPSSQDRDFLATLIEDGWPLVILASGLDPAQLKKLQATALSLVRQGLAGIYGRPEDARHVRLAEAETIILDADSWHEAVWFISTTEAGNALLGAPNEW
jgi:hypothetical protein